MYDHKKDSGGEMHIPLSHMKTRASVYVYARICLSILLRSHLLGTIWTHLPLALTQDVIVILPLPMKSIMKVMYHYQRFRESNNPLEFKLTR